MTDEIDEILMDTEERLEKSLHALEHDFRRIRTGRASPNMIEHVHVEAYGAMTPINQVATVSVPEPGQLLVKPWDKGSIHAIEKALTNANLGMSPQNDGEVIRLNIPPLSEERRKELATQAKDMAEKAKVAMRNVRRDGIKGAESVGKDLKLSEDEVKKSAEDITELLKTYEGKVEDVLKAKVDDILHI